MAENLKEKIERYRQLYEQGVLDDAFISYADALREAKNFTLALNICRQGLASNPDSLPARLLLSRILLDMGHYHKAQAEVEKVLKRAPDSFLALITLARILLRKKEFTRAKQIVEKLGESVPFHPELSKLKDELNQYLDTIETLSPDTGTKSIHFESPSERAKLLVDLLKKDKEIKDFYIVPTEKSTSEVNLPAGVLDLNVTFNNLYEKFKEILHQDLETIVIESSDGAVFITSLKNILLVVMCTPKARIGKIKMLIHRVLLGESIEKTGSKDTSEK